jgi:putative FmdB family regulatory protein
MPIYEYECTKCGHQAEVWQRITDQSATKCERCKGKMRKLISQSSFHLKGTGWYVTDYASKKGTDAKKPKKTESKVSEDTVKKDSSASTAKSED